MADDRGGFQVVGSGTEAELGGVMTVEEAKKIVREKYPAAVAGNVRGSTSIAVKHYPYGSPCGPWSRTIGQAWKRCAEEIQDKLVH
jgi:hypothetical protein